MSDAPSEIVLCPSERRTEAVALVLCEIAPSQRQEIAGALLDGGGSDVSSEALYVAQSRTSTSSARLVGAAWGQRQPGNTAVLWPPRLVVGEELQTSERLADAVVRQLDAAGVEMTQALLPSQDSDLVPVVVAAGFSHLADLIYMSCESDLFPTQQPACDELQFLAYDPAERNKLIDVVERTYQGTLDCEGLNGMRRMEDVIDGYRETGVFRPENWLIAVSGGQDIGVLLLADHPRARHWELMYMGLVPEARGNGWGCEIARHAQWLARRAGVERIVLAVDAANRPALAMYERAGFSAWDRRSVFVRILR
jgi:ribosomal protein S18 acetylase RimI-like enzyme